MMTGYFYSPAQSGFYHASVHAVMPDDAVAIADDSHAQLMQALSEGQRILMVDGQPMAAPPLPPTEDFLLQQLRDQRDKLLAGSDHKMMPDYPASEAEREAWRLYRQQLRDLPETITDPADILWPEPPTGDSS